LDVTKWMKRHPGGSKVLRMFSDGRDATEVFRAFHSPEATRKMEIMAAASPVAPKLTGEAAAISAKRAASFESMRQEFIDAGYFNNSSTYVFACEIGKVAWIASLFIAGSYLLRATQHVYVGATLFMLGMQQSGWAGHDYSHHSVLKSPVLNDVVSRAFGWLQGYELMWWKARHNPHHVTCNELENDPDVRTSPLLTYVKARLSPLQKWQHVYFLPSLSLLHLYWRFESWVYCATRLRKMWPNLLLLALNAAWMTWTFQNAGWGPLLFCIFTKGFCTGSVVFSTHYAEDRLHKDHALSLAEQTVITSRNISGSWLIHAFSGMISYQVEHHLFPMMSRCRYPSIAPRVKQWCNDEGLPYNESSFAECLALNMKKLKNVARAN